MAEQLQLSADLASLPEFMGFAADQARKAGFPSQRVSEVELVLEEALVNVMENAYPGHSGELTLRAESTEPQRLVVEIRDQGKAFNPLDRDDPDTGSGLMERPVGGLGIFLMKKFADRVAWQRQGNENCLTIIFRERHDR